MFIIEEVVGAYVPIKPILILPDFLIDANKSSEAVALVLLGVAEAEAVPCVPSLIYWNNQLAPQI